MSAELPRLGVDHPTVVPAGPADEDDETPADEVARDGVGTEQDAPEPNRE